MSIKSQIIDDIAQNSIMSLSVSDLVHSSNAHFVTSSKNKFENVTQKEADTSLVDTSKYFNYMKQQLFQAVQQGNIEELDNLLDLPYADINCTMFSENLLMCAIRSGNEKIAEYLICKGVDVTYEVDLFEFHEKSTVPIHYHYYSCREMAYDHGMQDIVNLIDFFNESTHWKIVQFIGKKLFKLSNKDDSGDKISEEMRRLYKKRLETLYVKHKNFTDIEANETVIEETDEKSDYFYVDASKFKPKSNISMAVSFGGNTTVPNGDDSVLNVDKRLKKDVHSSMIKQYLKTNPNNFHSFNEIYNKKQLSYRGYKLTFDINYVDENEKKVKNSKLLDKKFESSSSSTIPYKSKINTNLYYDSKLSFPLRSSYIQHNRPKTSHSSNNLKTNSNALKLSSSFKHSNNSFKKASINKSEVKDIVSQNSIKKFNLSESHNGPILKNP